MILKSLSLCVLHELLQRYQSVSILVHLGEGGSGGGGREGEIYYIISLSYPLPSFHIAHTYLREDVLSHARHLLMGFHPLHVITVRLLHL